MYDHVSAAGIVLQSRSGNTTSCVSQFRGHEDGTHTKDMEVFPCNRYSDGCTVYDGRRIDAVADHEAVYGCR